MDAKTFDLSEMISGIDYPEVRVPVFISEKAAYEIAELDDRIAADPTNEELEAERQSLIEASSEYRYEFHLRGVPRATYNAMIDAVGEEFPPETTELGRLKPNPEADKAVERKLWALYTVSITNPKGERNDSITEEEAAGLIKALPYSAVAAVGEAISALAIKTRKGFEDLALETDFLSQR